MLRNAELTLDKPSRNVVGVAPLKLTISPLLQIAMDERRSSLHLILERENESGTTEVGVYDFGMGMDQCS